MPRPLARDPKTGVRYTADPETGQWRPLTTEEIGNLRPSKVLDEMGVDPVERFTLKNFLNAGVAAQWLRSRGYEVLKYGSGLNFAVRKSPGDPWKVVDPQKGGIGEFFQDMLDISVGDVALPALGGAAGTLLGGGPIGFGAGAAASEVLRQGIGTAITGESENISPGQAAVVGGVSAALPVVGKPLAAVARKGAGALARGLSSTGAIHRGMESFASRITGIRPAQGLSVLDILSARANTRRPFGTPADTLDVLQRHLDEVAGPTLTRAVSHRDRMVEGASVNIREVIERRLDFKGERGRSLSNMLGPFRERRGDAAATEMNDMILGYLNAPTMAQAAAQAGPEATTEQVEAAFAEMIEAWLTRLESVPAPVALRIRSGIQKYVAERGGYTGRVSGAPGAAEPLEPALAKDSMKFAHQFVSAVHKDLSNQGLEAAVEADARIHVLAQARDTLRHFIGTDRTNAQAIVSKAFEPRPPEFMGKTFLEAAKDYDAAFPGVSWRDLIDETFVPTAAAGAPGTAEGLARESFIGQQFTPRVGRRETYGLPEAFARPTSVGGPLGAQYVMGGLAGAAGGFAIGGGIPGAIIGAPVGFLAFSPANIVRVAPWIAKAGRVVRGRAHNIAVRTSPLLSPEAQVAAGMALQGIARGQYGKTLVENETPRRQRRVLIVGQ